MPTEKKKYCPSCKEEVKTIDSQCADCGEWLGEEVDCQTTEGERWEEEFDEEFVGGEEVDETNGEEAIYINEDVNPNDIKSFIRKIESQAYARAIRDAREAVETRFQSKWCSSSVKIEVMEALETALKALDHLTKDSEK